MTLTARTKKFGFPVIISALILATMSATPAVAASTEATVNSSVHEMAAAKKCGFAFWGQTYTNCGKSKKLISVQYVGGDPGMGFQFMAKDFCVAKGKSVYVGFPVFWMAEGILDKGKC